MTTNSTSSPRSATKRRPCPVNHAVSDAATGAGPAAGQRDASGNTSTSDWLEERRVDAADAPKPGVAIDLRATDPKSLPGHANESKRGQQ